MAEALSCFPLVNIRRATPDRSCPPGAPLGVPGVGGFVERGAQQERAIREGFGGYEADREDRGSKPTHCRATRASSKGHRATLAGMQPNNELAEAGTARECSRDMSRIETEAQEALLRRRRTLARATPDGRVQSDESRDDALPDGILGELADIDAALARIREGSYGVCVACGGPMGLQRLRAIPEARYCLSCSGHAEG